MTDPIHAVVDRWHDFLRSGEQTVLDELLADEVVFYSPVVFTPQEGKDLTAMYLTAATQAFPGDRPEGAPDGEVLAADGDDEGRSPGAFHYTKKVMSGDTAVLEFETTMEGKHVNGVDIIRCDDQGQIIEFRVMIRPLQAVNAVHAQMRAMLDSLSGS